MGDYMMFCPKCGSMLRPKLVKDKKVMACSCGFTDSKSDIKTGIVKLKNEPSENSNFDVIEKEQSAHPIVDAECPKCKHDKAYYWTRQMRAGDEPETQFYKCLKCTHTWRDSK